MTKLGKFLCEGKAAVDEAIGKVVVFLFEREREVFDGCALKLQTLCDFFNNSLPVRI